MQNLLIMFAASFLIWLMFMGIFVMWFLDGRITKELVVHGIVAFILAWIIADILKFLFPTVRPFLVNGGPTDVLFPEKNGAFPSGHTSAAFGLAVTFWFHNKKIGLTYLVLALAVGVARVLANVHYPIDILGGVFVGTAVAFLIEKVHFFKAISGLKKHIKV